VVADMVVAQHEGPGAYKVELVNGHVEETRYGVGSNFS